MKYWQQLLKDWTISNTVYSEDKWQMMVDGVVESFCQYTNTPFVHTAPPRFYLDKDNHNNPCVGFDLIYKSLSPIEPLVYFVKGSIDTYIDDGKKYITVFLFLFLYFGEKRLLAENIDTDSKNDYIVFKYNMEGQEFYWENKGWESGMYGEWDGIKYQKD